MKKSIMIAIMVTGLFLGAPARSNAVTPLALDGNDYTITAFCRNDAGDYCSQGDIIQDVFGFEDNKLLIDSFDGGVLGVGGSGDFDDNGLTFTASYEVITDDLDKYTFDVKGINLIDIIILGRMDIAFFQLSLSGYDKKDETTAFFFGIK